MLEKFAVVGAVDLDSITEEYNRTSIGTSCAKENEFHQWWIGKPIGEGVGKARGGPMGLAAVFADGDVDGRKSMLNWGDQGEDGEPTEELFVHMNIFNTTHQFQIFLFIFKKPMIWITDRIL